MLVYVNRTKIEKKPENKVTSHLIFEPHRRQSVNNLKFDENGIFSKRIFGNLYKCDCGKVSNEGYCQKCNTRVIDPKNMPDFYIDLTINVACSFADFENCGINPEIAKEIIEYKRYVVVSDDGNTESHYFDNENLSSIKDIDESKVFIGIAALKKLGVSDEWISYNTVDYLNVPHTIYRPIVIDNKNMPFITGINNLYSDIIKKINDVIDLHNLAHDRPFYLMVEYSAIVNIYNDIIEKLFDELQNVKYSIIKSEIISHPISGAIRAVLTNRHDIDEDVLIIGDTLVETLWPYLYKKFDGNMALINEELVNKNYLVLVNRPPSISHMSIIAMKPRIASIYPYNKLYNSDRGLKHNYRYVEESKDKIGLLKDKEGDIEKFGQGLDDGIDTVGVRTIGMNPIVFDGLAADTDGDVLLVIALYSKDALKQANNILPSKCFTNYANGTIRNHIIEDFMFTDDGD